MKKCPVCKTTYTDDSLRFCLADGTSLFSPADEPETVRMSSRQNPLRVDISQDTIPSNSLPPPQNQSKAKSVVPFIIAAIAGLLLIGIAGIAALIIINPFGKTETPPVSNTTNNLKPTATSVLTSDNQFDRIGDKLTEPEKQIQTQTNQKNISNIQPLSSPKQNEPVKPTARVAPSNDGFLSLRTEPSVKTGTQLVKIPSGATVYVENCEKNYMTVDGRRGRWCMVSYAGKIGWVFDAWLIY
jgi:hypothetical protein